MLYFQTLFLAIFKSLQQSRISLSPFTKDVRVEVTKVEKFHFSSLFMGISKFIRGLSLAHPEQLQKASDMELFESRTMKMILETIKK